MPLSQISDVADGLTALHDRFLNLAGELESAANDLRHPGTPPAGDLAERLHSTRRDFEQVRAQILLLAEQWQVPTPRPQTISSIKALEKLLERIRQGVLQAGAARARDKAAATLAQALLLRRSDGSISPELAALHSEASQLQAELAEVTLPDLHPAVEALSRIEHPLAAAVALATQHAVLGEERAAHLQQLVGAKFGTSLAIAMLMGRVVAVEPVVEELPPPVVTTASPEPEPPPTAAAVATGEPATSIDDAPMPATDIPTSPQPLTAPAAQASDSDSALTAPTMPDTVAAPPFAPGTPSALDIAASLVHEYTSNEAAEAPAPTAIPETPSALAPIDAVEEPPSPASEVPSPSPLTLLIESVRRTAPSPEAAFDLLIGLGPLELHAQELTNGYKAARTAETTAVSSEVQPTLNFGEASTAVPGTAPHRRRTAPLVPAPAEQVKRSPASQLAAQLAALPDHAPADELVKLLWLLLAADRNALAYQLAVYLEQTGRQDPAGLPSALLGALILGTHVNHDTGFLASQLRLTLDSFDFHAHIGGADEPAHARRLLLLSAQLRPSLVAPNVDGGFGLEAILEVGLPDAVPLPSLAELVRAIATYAAQRSPLDLALLGEIRQEETWLEQLRSLQQEAQAWLEEASLRKIAYVHGAKVWQAWLRPQGLIGQLLQPVIKHDTDAVARVQKEARRLADRNTIKTEVNATNEKLPHESSLREIEYATIDQIHQYTGTATRIALRWVQLVNSQPKGAGISYARNRMEEIGLAVMTLAPQAAAEVSELEASNCACLAAAAAVCHRAVDRILAMFTADSAPLRDEPDIKHLLHGVLLADSETSLDDDWAPLRTDDHLLYAVLRLAEVDELPWEPVLEEHSRSRDHVSTARIIEFLSSCPDPSADLASLVDRRETHLRTCKAELDHLARLVSQKIENAVASGLLREQERDARISQVQQIVVSDHPDFRSRFLALHGTASEIDSRREVQIRHIRARLEATVPASEPAYTRILQFLESGDTLTANEYIDLVASGAGIPTAESHRDALAGFFPQWLAAVVPFLERRFDAERAAEHLRTFAHAASDGDAPGERAANLISGAHAESAARLLQAWFATGNQEKLTTTLLETILQGIGFAPTRIAAAKSTPRRRRDQATVTTEPVQDRNLCPVRQYGSDANGEYAIWACWDQPSAEDLLNDVGERPPDQRPLLVFYFGHMDGYTRRELARLSREWQRTFVVLDDALLLYLCRYPAARMRLFFECALPFTFLIPYITSGQSIVAPEIFYGRSRQREQIIDPSGTCFLYGGRQLGKTALLRRIERSLHRPNEGRIVLWIDLRDEGIGYNRSIDELWQLIAAKLKKDGVVPERTPLRTSAERILEHIQGWLEGDPRRRLFLLLDEADRFLESDGKTNEFQHAARIKGLMERTSRRFKVVFAGLHNVQRTARQRNHPLAQLGTPICIGPLLEDGEWREARALIEQPLITLGYRFESPDLVTQILTQTNYYPSLIQLYCAQLLRRMTDGARSPFDTRISPPYVITEKLVNETIGNKDLRASIRQRFNLTLQLDQRYEVIAYVVALKSLALGSDGLTRGFRIDEIRDEVLERWEEGFRESKALDTFQVLADELVGLGVLRATGPQSYALRSANLLPLLGASEDIEHELARTREPSTEYDPATFRAAYRTVDGDPESARARRSPLTAQQESDLRSRNNGIAVIHGCDMADLTEVPVFLQQAFGADFYQAVSPSVDFPGFAAGLEDILTRPADGTSVLFVPAVSGWNNAWLAAGRQFLNRLVSTTSFVRIVFLADPRKSWELLSEQSGASGGGREVDRTALRLTLQPWQDAAVRQWVDDCGIEPRHAEGRRTLHEITGNWPRLLARYYEIVRTRPATWEDALRSLESELSRQSVAVEMLRSFGVTRAEHRRILQILWIGTHMSLDEVSDELDGAVPAGIVQQTLHWADLLGLAAPGQKGRWSLNPVVARLFSVAGE